MRRNRFLDDVGGNSVRIKCFKVTTVVVDGEDRCRERSGTEVVKRMIVSRVFIVCEDGEETAEVEIIGRCSTRY